MERLSLENRYPRISITPRRVIITGALGTSHLTDKRRPAKEAAIPANQPTMSLVVKLPFNITDNEAGRIRKAKTVNIPAMFTACTTTRPKEK